ncbi:MAG: 4-(cytidine 5'-diphospho)-2-C-methyl-D-erythritol kinase [Bryobacterales bacterium]|jgi:4-diphosphocytidyl-2-C-methyl-D-erythritol kinase|nr:4-(cytidine 5'-diphospho)-2-C-methyl-D-erythritol kinase [Bryobacterales bacterium]
MTTEPRRARVPAFAKINLGLKVLNRRPDGYHELRTVYQTISLADTLEIEFVAARRNRVSLAGGPEIPDNLVLRAARLALGAMRATGEVRLRLQKNIPMGSGLGGGSSDAAAVLLALPYLAAERLSPGTLLALAAELGSDVPAFLLGGATLGVGRGSEVYPLPDPPRAQGLLVVPDFRISTPEAYQALGRSLTNAAVRNMINSFQSCVWHVGAGVPGGIRPAVWENDFEEVALRFYPRLRAIRTKLRRLGANPAMLTGSGSALYGLFRTREEVQAALPHFRKERVHPFHFISRDSYRACWRRRLGPDVDRNIWPPQRQDASRSRIA